jgi:predicted GNAT family acetyltransferase
VTSDLEERIAAAMIAAWRDRAAGVSGGEVLGHDGLVLALTNLPADDQNVTLVEREPSDPVAALRTADGLFRSRGRTFGVKVVVGRTPGVEAAIRSLGLERAVAEPVMAVSVADVVSCPAPPGVAIRRATTASDREIALEVEVEVFGTARPVAEALLPLPDAGHPRMRSYVATLDGVAVAAAHVRRHERVVGVFGVGTVERARGRGIGGAITSFAALDHRVQADLAWLEASAAGRAVYERIGFRPIGRSEVWVRRGGEVPPRPA